MARSSDGIYSEVGRSDDDGQVDAGSARNYLKDHLRSLARISQRAGSEETAALILLAVVSLEDEVWTLDID